MSQVALRERHVSIATADGKMLTYICHPAGAASTSDPALIFYIDAPGMRSELRRMARRLAAGVGRRAVITSCCPICTIAAAKAT